MIHPDDRKAEGAGAIGATTYERRESPRTTLSRAGSYQFNVQKGDLLEFYEGRALVRDIGSAGMGIELDREPQERGIIEVQMADQNSNAWVWIIGICWVRGRADGRKWMAGGRLLFGRCLN